MSFENLYDQFVDAACSGAVLDFQTLPEGYEIAEHLSFHDEIVLQPTPAKPPRIIRSFEDLYDSFEPRKTPRGLVAEYSLEGRQLLGVVFLAPFGELIHRGASLTTRRLVNERDVNNYQLIAVVYAKCN